MKSIDLVQVEPFRKQSYMGNIVGPFLEANVARVSPTNTGRFTEDNFQVETFIESDLMKR